MLIDDRPLRSRCSAMLAVKDRQRTAGGPWSFSSYADRAIKTATIAHRVAGNCDSRRTADTRIHHSYTADTHIHSYTAGTFHTRSDMDCSMLRTRSTLAYTHAEVPCD